MRPWKVLVLVAALTTSPVTALPAMAAVEPDPLVGHGVFNDPAGAVAAQNAIYAQLGRLIDRVPAGGEVLGSVMDFDPPNTADTADAPDIVDRLIAASQRGVKVKFITVAHSANTQATTRLRAALGSNDAAGSYVVHCKDQFPNGPDRGCIATRAKEWSTGTVSAYNHSKFFTFSSVVLNNGTSIPNVVYQSSSNLTQWDENEAYNNAFTWTDARTYAAYRTYFEDLRRYRYTAAGNNNYYQDTGSGTDYRAFFFPRQEPSGRPFDDPQTDTIHNTLQSVACSYTENGTKRQTDIRIAMLDFNRPAIAQKLAELKGKGCWVDVVLTNANDAVISALTNARIQTTRCDWNNGPGLDIRVHSKYMLLDGAYDDDIIPRVYTGSHNYSYSALRQADEQVVRIMGRTVHDEYLRNFWSVRDTCRSHDGIIF
ncbi:phosphatidylserine/phosphatidylglycerophosphate/cardiolipin synthase family protein [Umezawaea endophytica]